MVEKAISLYKSDFTEEQWEIICNEFLCGECPYEKYDDKVSHQYIMRCIHMLMQDINKLYFEEGTNK